MTTAQKIIKYFATAFAAFLIITIISAIMSGIFGLMSVLGLVNQDKNTITKDLNVIASEVNDIATLKIDVAFTSLEIKTADTFKVETNNSKLSFRENNGCVEIKEENQNWFMKDEDTSTLSVFIPESQFRNGRICF